MDHANEEIAKFDPQPLPLLHSKQFTTNKGALHMRIVLYKSVMFFALLASFSVFGENQQSDCRSWWSGLDGVHHCLLSGNGEDEDVAPTPKEGSNTEILPAEASPDDISATNNASHLPQLPPDFQITSVPEN